MSPLDLAWEALVRETKANPAMERGALNKALKAIREAYRSEGLLEEDLPGEIHTRAIAYRRVFPNAALTPTALAKHWFRVMDVGDPVTPQQQAIDALRRRMG